MIDLSQSPLFPRLPEELLISLLALPSTRSKPLRVVVDTDLDNEIDDFFALVHLCLAQAAAEVQLEAIYAAPYSFRSRLLDMLQAMDLQKLPARVLSKPEQDLVASYADQINQIQQNLNLDPRSFLWPPEGAPESAPPNAYDHVAIGPQVGMERSFTQARELLDLIGSDTPLFRGANSYLQNGCPVRSEAVDHLIDLARSASSANPIYVIGLACATNLASALLLAPDIRDKVVMTWTAGYPTNVTDLANTSFNLSQDVAAAQVLFSSGVPLVYLPGFYIGQQLTLSQPDIEHWFAGTGRIGAALAELYRQNPLFNWYGIDANNLSGRIWNIWDLINGAWLVKPGSVASRLVRAPKLNDDRYWVPDPDGNWIRENTYTSYNSIFPDFVTRLASFDT
jgi:inosine-uridine nucleoside N-ribohydrolase